MKKLRRAVLLGMMICSLTACGKDENNTRDKRISEPYTVVEGVTIVFGTEYVTTEETTMSPDTEPEIDDETKQTADSTPNDTKSDTVASSPASTAPLLEFNGNADEIVTADKDSYYLGGKYVLYVEAGAKLPGNTPENLDRIMSELEELYKLSFKKTSYIEKEPWLNEYFGNTFNGINTDLDKINILIVRDNGDGAIQWSDKNTLMLFDDDFYFDNGTFDTVYHELAHILRLRQGPNLGQTFEEGIALYAQDRLARTENFPAWSMIQYVSIDGYEPRYDRSQILENPEEEFRRVTLEERSADQVHYHYGFRFITFLEEAYGPEIIDKICEISRKYDFSYDDVDMIIRVIKEAAGDDVFEKFAEWLPDGWYKWCRDYLDYMKQFGLE